MRCCARCVDLKRDIYTSYSERHGDIGLGCFGKSGSSVVAPRRKGRRRSAPLETSNMKRFFHHVWGSEDPKDVGTTGEARHLPGFIFPHIQVGIAEGCRSCPGSTTHNPRHATPAGYEVQIGEDVVVTWYKTAKSSQTQGCG